MNDVITYIEKLEDPQKSALKNIYNCVKEYVPEAVETTSYGVATFKYKDKFLIGIASAKKHLSIYPGAGAIEANAEKLSGLKLSKGTVRFTVEHPLPNSTLKSIVMHRKKDIEREIREKEQKK
jgi:uncharacterized protein YdhG (YjbR/CyaY superfamily)